MARFTARPPAIQDFTAAIVAAEGHTAPGMMRTRWPGSQNFLTELENPFLPWAAKWTTSSQTDTLDG